MDFAAYDPIECAIVFTVLFLLALGYNALTAWMEETGRMAGYTAVMVVGGVAGTIAGAVFLIGLVPALMMAGCFIASGTPMIIGSIRRHTAARRKDDERLRALLFETLQEQGDAEG